MRDAGFFCQGGSLPGAFLSDLRKEPKENQGAARAFSRPYPPPPGPQGTSGRRYGLCWLARLVSCCSSYRSGRRTTSAVAPRHITGQDLMVVAFVSVPTSRHKVCAPFTWTSAPCQSARAATRAARRYAPALPGVAMLGAPRQRMGMNNCVVGRNGWGGSGKADLSPLAGLNHHAPLAPPLGPGPKPWFSFRPLSQTRKRTPARERRPRRGRSKPPTAAPGTSSRSPPGAGCAGRPPRRGGPGPAGAGSPTSCCRPAQ